MDTETKDRQMEMEPRGNTDFDKIYKTNAEIVYKTAVKYSGNHHEAEEIAQTVFLKLYVNRENINLEAARGWLILTTKYMALNRNRDLEREYLVDDFIGGEEADSAEIAENPEDIFLRKMKERQYMKLKEKIFEALYAKSPRWYDAVTITYVLEKPQKEVAEKMGVTLEVLQAVLYRARRWMRENYAEEYAHLDKA